MATKLPSIMPDRDLSVTSTLELNTYNVTFKVDGTTVGTDVKPYTFPIEYPSNSAIQAAVPTGYEFKGWDSNPSTMPAGDTTINAKLEKVQYTVKYYIRMQIVDDMSYASPELMTTQTYTYGEKITPPTYQSPIGYKAIKWKDLPDTMPASNLEITGDVDVALFTATFVVDGKTVKTESLAYGVKIPYPADPTKEYHNFVAWDPSPSTMPAENITITAVFEEIPEHTISYYTRKQYYNAETGKIDYTQPELLITQTYRVGDTIDPPEYPTEDGYTATGWEY